MKGEENSGCYEGQPVSLCRPTEQWKLVLIRDKNNDTHVYKNTSVQTRGFSIYTLIRVPVAVHTCKYDGYSELHRLNPLQINYNHYDFPEETRRSWISAFVWFFFLHQTCLKMGRERSDIILYLLLGSDDFWVSLGSKFRTVLLFCWIKLMAGFLGKAMCYF